MSFKHFVQHHCITYFQGDKASHVSFRDSPPGNLAKKGYPEGSRCPDALRFAILPG